MTLCVGEYVDERRNDGKYYLGKGGDGFKVMK